MENLLSLQFAEFNIQFAFDHLKRVVQAYHGLCVRKGVDNALEKIDRDILALEEKRKRIIATKSKKKIQINWGMLERGKKLANVLSGQKKIALCPLSQTN